MNHALKMPFSPTNQQGSFKDELRCRCLPCGHLRMRLPSYLSISSFCVGWPREGISKTCREGTAFIWRRPASPMQDPSVSSHLPGMVTPSHQGTEARWSIFRLFPAAHRSFCQVQMVAGACSQQVAAPKRTHSLCLSQILMVGKAWPQVSGWITEQLHAPIGLQLLF